MSNKMPDEYPWTPTVDDLINDPSPVNFEYYNKPKPISDRTPLPSKEHVKTIMMYDLENDLEEATQKLINLNAPMTREDTHENLAKRYRFLDEMLDVVRGTVRKMKLAMPDTMHPNIKYHYDLSRNKEKEIVQGLIVVRLKSLVLHLTYALELATLLANARANNLESAKDLETTLTKVIGEIHMIKQHIFGGKSKKNKKSKAKSKSSSKAKATSKILRLSSTYLRRSPSPTAPGRSKKNRK